MQRSNHIPKRKFSIKKFLTALIIFLMSLIIYSNINFSSKNLFSFPSSTSSLQNFHLRGNSLLSNPKEEFLIIDALSTMKSHLIIVAGHAVLNINGLGKFSLFDEKSWNLLDYQIGQGFPAIISSHIQKGIDIAQQDKHKSVLIFSGGQTRHDAGPISEAASYYYYALTTNMLTSQSDVTVTLEEYARDSFENVLFSISRFKEHTGHYPETITVVGFDFKQKRFTDIIRRAIIFPADQFDYVGIRPNSTLFDYERAVQGEQEVYRYLEKDMYGCNTPALRDKKVARNPFHRTIPYELSCPELKEMLSWCQSYEYTGVLPWSP